VRASERAIVKGGLEFRIAESSCDDRRGYTLVVDVQSKNDDDDSEAQRNVGWGNITTQSRWARTPRILLFCRISPSDSTYAFPRDPRTCGRARKGTTQPPVKSRVVVSRVDSQARFRRPPPLFPPLPPIWINHGSWVALSLKTRENPGLQSPGRNHPQLIWWILPPRTVGLRCRVVVARPRASSRDRVYRYKGPGRQKQLAIHPWSFDPWKILSTRWVFGWRRSAADSRLGPLALWALFVVSRVLWCACIAKDFLTKVASFVAHLRLLWCFSILQTSAGNKAKFLVFLFSDFLLCIFCFRAFFSRLFFCSWLFLFQDYLLVVSSSALFYFA
jgi:hypothetical protein